MERWSPMATGAAIVALLMIADAGPLDGGDQLLVQHSDKAD